MSRDFVSSQTETWGLVSDIHGNLAALERALQVLAMAGARKLAFLGDYLGKGDSDRCVRLIKALADVAIVGNRDLDWQDRVAPETKAYVLSLPRTAQVGQLLISHGDLRLTPSLSTAQITKGFVRARVEMEQRNARVWAFGHSHHARVWRLQETAELIRANAIQMEHALYALNVGTTGLPFPGKGGPSVALLDFKQGEIRQIALESA